MKLTDAQAVEIGLQPPPSAYLNVPFDKYLEWPYPSKSALHEFARYPAYHRARLDGELPKKKSVDYDIGSAVDSGWVEQLDLHAAGFAVRPRGIDLRTTEGKGWAANHAGLKIVPPTVNGMIASLNENRKALELRDGSQAQVSLVWDCPITGMRMRGRPDLVDFEKCIITDLKTTKSVRAHSFRNDVSEYNYHWQLHLYITALTELGFGDDWQAWIIAVEKQPVHPVACRPLSAQALELAARETTRQLLRYRECLLSGSWPRDDNDEQPIELPTWRYRKENHSD